MMAGQSLGLLALLVLNPLIQESHGTWSLYEKFFFAPRGLPPNPEQTSNCSSDDPDTCNPEGNQEEGNARDRGSKSSPDPEADAEWIWWAIRIWWISIGKLADTGLVWCGTMCVCWRSCPMELLAPGRYSRSVPLPAPDLDRDLGAVSVLATLPRPPKVLVWARRLARSGAFAWH